jgi:hypothetical protein
MGMKIKQKVTKPRHPKMVSHGDVLDYSNKRTREKRERKRAAMGVSKPSCRPKPSCKSRLCYLDFTRSVWTRTE